MKCQTAGGEVALGGRTWEGSISGKDGPQVWCDRCVLKRGMRSPGARPLHLGWSVPRGKSLSLSEFHFLRTGHLSGTSQFLRPSPFHASD